MKLSVSLEYRFDVSPDGSIWTQTVFPYSFWQRYLEVFDSVNIVARARIVDEVRTDAHRVDGANVTFSALPYYLGPTQYLRRQYQLRQSIMTAIGPNDAVIMRVGSQIASVIERRLLREARPYGIEVVGDPYDVFAPGAVRHPLRPLFRWWFSRQLRLQCSRASGVAYVTEHALQRRYPTAQKAFSTYYSDVELPEGAFATTNRSGHNPQSSAPLVLTYIGTFEQLYKAPDVLLEATALAVRDGLDLELRLIGDGQYRSQLEKQAAELGISQRVRFLGQLPAGTAVRAELDKTDLFVLPSRVEGLPRAIIEAMARGLPCIGSTVGGIPELLPQEDLVPPGDAIALVSKIREVITSPERIAQMSERNLEKAKSYQDGVLRARRIEFYSYVRDQTEAWLKRRGER